MEMELQALDEQGDDWIRGVVYDGLTQTALGHGSQPWPFQVYSVYRGETGEIVAGEARYYQESLFAVGTRAAGTTAFVGLRFDAGEYAPCDIPEALLSGGSIMRVPLFPARSIEFRVRRLIGELPKDLRVEVYDCLGRSIPQFALDGTDPCLLSDDGTTFLLVPVGDVVAVLLLSGRLIGVGTGHIDAGVERGQVWEVVIP